MSRPGFTFLVCPDVGLMTEELNRQLTEFGQGYERKVYWADDDDFPGGYWDELGVPSLMGTKKAVTLRRAENLVVDDLKALTNRLAGFNDMVWPIFCLENEWTKARKPAPKIDKKLTKQKYWAVAEKKGWIWRSAGLNKNALADFIRRFAQREGLKIQPAAVAKLCDVLPMDAVAVGHEMEKIALAAGERGEILPEDAAVVSFESEMNIFEFINAALSGKTDENVWRRVFDNHAASSSESILFSFLALLRMELRTLWRLSVGDPDVPGNPHALKYKQPLAAKLGPRGVAAIWDLVLEAEFGIKSGSRDVEQAFEALIAGMHRQTR